MEKKYLISEASKILDVEPHVLRYWEEELNLNVERNEMGHRMYSKENLDKFKEIKELKEKGYGLRAVKEAIERPSVGENMDKQTLSNTVKLSVCRKEEPTAVPANLKMEQFRDMLTDIIEKALDKNNVELTKNVSSVITKTVSTNVIKEMNYLERVKEEQEEERYRQFDETLRQFQQGASHAAAALDGKKKTHKFFSRKKH